MVVPGVLIPMNLVRTQAGQPIYQVVEGESEFVQEYNMH